MREQDTQTLIYKKWSQPDCIALASVYLFFLQYASTSSTVFYEWQIKNIMINL